MEAGEGFLCSLGSIQLMSGYHIAKISCRGKEGFLAECLLTSTVLSMGKGRGRLLRGCGWGDTRGWGTWAVPLCFLRFSNPD